MTSNFRLLGVRIDQTDWAEIDRFCQSTLSQKNKTYIVTLNGEIALKAAKDQTLKDAIEAAGLVIPDSTNVVWVGRLKGGHFKERTPGSDLVERVALMAARNNYSLFLLGGQDGVAQETGEILTRKYPDLRIAGASNADPEDRGVIDQIISCRPDIIFVAYGAPKQEVWLRQHLNELPCSLGVGVGGTFDMISGRTPRAPKFFRALSIEWLWRLALQPSRIVRIYRSIVIFPLKALFQK